MYRILILLIIGVVNLLHSQVKMDTTNNVSRYKAGILRLSAFINPATSLDIRISNRIIVVNKLGIAMSYLYNGITDKVTFFADPLYEFHIRYFYNFAKRLSKGKRISNNSGNYFGIYFSPTLGRDAYFLGYVIVVNQNLLGPYWGIQRSIGKKELFYLDCGLGIVYSWNPRAINHSFIENIVPFPYVSIGLNLYSFNLPVKHLLGK